MRDLSDLEATEHGYAYVSNVEEQALEVGKLGRSELQKTRVVILNGARGSLVRSKRIWEHVNINIKVARCIHAPEARRTRVVPVSVIPAVFERMGVPAAP